MYEKRKKHRVLLFVMSRASPKIVKIPRYSELEPFCSKKWQKKSPGQETGLGKCLKVLIDTKLILFK